MLPVKFQAEASVDVSATAGGFLLTVNSTVRPWRSLSLLVRLPADQALRTKIEVVPMSNGM
jgi:hypothetical protein